MSRALLGVLALLGFQQQLARLVAQHAVDQAAVLAVGGGGAGQVAGPLQVAGQLLPAVGRIGQRALLLVQRVGRAHVVAALGDTAHGDLGQADVGTRDALGADVARGACQRQGLLGQLQRACRVTLAQVVVGEIGQAQRAHRVGTREGCLLQRVGAGLQRDGGVAVVGVHDAAHRVDLVQRHRVGVLLHFDQGLRDDLPRAGRRVGAGGREGQVDQRQRDAPGLPDLLGQAQRVVALGHGRIELAGVAADGRELAVVAPAVDQPGAVELGGLHRHQLLAGLAQVAIGAQVFGADAGRRDAGSGALFAGGPVAQLLGQLVAERAVTRIGRQQATQRDHVELAGAARRHGRAAGAQLQLVLRRLGTRGSLDAFEVMRQARVARHRGRHGGHAGAAVAPGRAGAAQQQRGQRRAQRRS